MQLFIYKELTG